VLRGAPGQASVVAEVQILLSRGFLPGNLERACPLQRRGHIGAERRPCWSRFIAYSRADAKISKSSI